MTRALRFVLACFLVSLLAPVLVEASTGLYTDTRVRGLDLENHASVSVERAVTHNKNQRYAVAYDDFTSGFLLAARGARGLGNVQGGVAAADDALSGAQKWLGDGYKEIAPGVFRSEDGLRQFRMTTGDLTDPKLGPHVHFEAIAPDGRTIIENSHVLLPPTS